MLRFGVSDSGVGLFLTLVDQRLGLKGLIRVVWGLGFRVSGFRV